MLTKVFQDSCKTDKPKSRGLQFEDIYLNENFLPAESKRTNDCYVFLNYKLNITQADLNDSNMTID